MSEIQQNSTAPAETLSALQPDVLEAILKAERQSAETFSGRRVLDKAIVLANEISISARSETLFRIRQCPPEHPFFVIAAGILTIEIPAVDTQAAVIDYLYEGPSLAGNPGQPGHKGRSWGVDWTALDGLHGGHGETGGPGVAGNTLDKPPLYIVYKEIRTFGGNPTTGLPLSINLYGYNGGNGGKGGAGGPGGDGAKGSPSSTRGLPFWPFVECTAGPGAGGDAGVRGQGGRGGDAGRGGNGGNIFFVGPRGIDDRYRKITSAFRVFFTGGQPGLPGAAGDVGGAGVPGAGGNLENPCVHGNSAGAHSAYPVPLDGGHGTLGVKGTDGQPDPIERSNLDIFPE